jgi:hypothetical protein
MCSSKEIQGKKFLAFFNKQERFNWVETNSKKEYKQD